MFQHVECFGDPYKRKKNSPVSKDPLPDISPLMHLTLIVFCYCQGLAIKNISLRYYINFKMGHEIFRVSTFEINFRREVVNHRVCRRVANTDENATLSPFSLPQNGKTALTNYT